MARLVHVAALLGTTVLWGSSFTAIKEVMNIVNSYRYTWFRALLASLGLLPYIAYLGLRGHWHRLAYAAKGGLAAGVAYTLGIWLQGWGTAYTTASNSAFVTGLNVVFVHLYQALVERRYSGSLALSLTLSVGGLYLLTSPSGGLGLGELLVLASAVAWAAQVIVVARYSGADPAAFTFFEALTATVMVVPDLLIHGPDIGVPYSALPYLAYLGLACTDAAFALQVYGQRGVSPAAAATILLLEPVFAALIAHFALGESYTLVQALGASMIVAAMLVSTLAGTP